MRAICEFKPDLPRVRSGENLTGQIILKTRAAESIKSIYITFIGRADVHFEETLVNRESDEKTPERLVSTATETYLTYRTEIFGKGKLPKGQHTFAFAIPLPSHCPSSISSKFGRVWYELSLVIERKWKVNRIHKTPIDVVQPYDLSSDPKSLVPIEHEAIRKLWRWPFRPGIINLCLKVPSGGYSPGQKMNYTLDVHNKSKRIDVKSYTVTLVQESEYFANGYRRVSPRSVYSETKSEVVKHLTKRTISANYEIPSVAPSSQMKSIIKVSYKLRLTVIFSGWHLKWYIEVPITIGTSPLASSSDGGSKKPRKRSKPALPRPMPKKRSTHSCSSGASYVSLPKRAIKKKDLSDVSDGVSDSELGTVTNIPPEVVPKVCSTSLSLQLISILYAEFF
ncbi:arrestin domain-containing protein 3-like [Drosophila mojavensis]|uniref:Arrestin C-terminal-like domain-containing protein n=1 Tax=Drosophila mojavensis TaxID=7230 RepID=A0A0Q9XCX5_DROMO|nr:arrestin domain-containing protein 3-like [Drosophila mojavensis]KRG06438.1 uncharacterized protein Dmoj_GI26011 [Drosophila mojavensis]